MAKSSSASRKILHQWSRPELLSRQVPEAMQMQHRTPTASGDREQDSPDWPQPFTEDVVVGESGSSGSAGEIPKTPPLHIPVRPWGKSGWKHNFSHFPRTSNCEKWKRTKITRAPCRRNPERREDRIPHKVLNEENESRLHRRYVVVQDSATHWIQSYPC